MSPEEQLLWKAFYSLEPYGNEIKHLVFIEAAIRNKHIKKLLPSECSLDQPLEDIDPEKAKKQNIAILNSMAEEFFEEAGLKGKG